MRFSNSARSDVKFLTSEVVQVFGGKGGDRKATTAADDDAVWTGSGAYVKPAIFFFKLCTSATEKLGSLQYWISGPCIQMKI